MEDIAPEDLEDLMSMLGGQAETPDLGRLCEQHPDVIKILAPLDPLKTAAIFAGLLTQEVLQSNCIRLEALVHLSIVHCRGERTISGNLVSQVFHAMGNGWCGRVEDPAEDVFVTNVVTDEGSFRVLEGVWESGGFHLQRVLNVMATLPVHEPFAKIRASVHALLRVSDAVCERAGLRRYQLGNAHPEQRIPAKALDRLGRGRWSVRFSKQELADLGISLDDLAPFIFRAADRDGLLAQALGHTGLERRPFAWSEEGLIFLLPSAVSAAIRRLLIGRVGSGPNQVVFTNALAHEYERLFANTPLLGDSPAPIYFGSSEYGPVASVAYEVDRGRHLHFLLLLDPLDDFEQGGLAGTFSAFGELADFVDEQIDSVYQRAHQSPEFHSGITFFVCCGVGRAISLWLNRNTKDGWKVETISAADLCTLSWTPKMKPLHLWRIFSARDALKQQGMQLQNINGLLNLVAWSRHLAGHLVPHAEIPADWAGKNSMIAIEQNSLLELRHEVSSLWDVHAVRDITGRWIALRRFARPLVPEDNICPIYVPESSPLLMQAACETTRRVWWCEVVLPENVSREMAYQRKMMVTTWLRRVALVVDAQIVSPSSAPILWRCVFDSGNLAAQKTSNTFDRAAARRTIQVNTDCGMGIIEFVISAEFDSASFSEENIAEQALVEALLDGAAALAERPLVMVQREALLLEIVPDTFARQSHVFTARDFRDYIDSLQHSSVLTISSYDVAGMKIGLGWRVRTMQEGGEINGKSECIEYLNRLVGSLEDALCAQLQSFNRRSLIEALMSNYEKAAQQRTWWRRTAAAQLSLHKDKEAVLAAMGLNETKLNGVFQATRILIEMAVCECPAKDGVLPGDLDLTQLMVLANTLFSMGGWSDAIRWDVMPARVVIRPMGDIHVHADFFDQVITPFGRTTSDRRFNDSAVDYALNLQEHKGVATTDISTIGDFFRAWQHEFGFSIDTMCRYIDALEDLGIRQQKFLVTMRRSELVQLLGAEGSTEEILNLFTLAHRPNWRSVPEGFKPADRQSWRFRRRLSTLRRPLLQVDDGEDPTLLVAPGLLREGFSYSLQNYYRGDFPDWQLGAPMSKWCGHSRSARGAEFNAEVAEKLRSLGWKVEPEIKLTKILRQALQRDYGDIDVFAWDATRNRILVIECKAVQYRKTAGEIAEQLSDFRGEIMPNGKPDLLRKHLDRMEVMQRYADTVCSFTQMPKATLIESHLVFKNPVPMQFVSSRADSVRISLFDDLQSL
jgi:hypothetical protein